MERVRNRRPPRHSGGQVAPSHPTLLPNSDAAISAQLSALRRYAFDEQDRPIVETQQRAYDVAGGPDSLRPVMLSIDAAPLRARRALAKIIQIQSQARWHEDDGERVYWVFG